ncbi:MAG: C45 family autoproteolytic acyltransferase/hydrolase [Myxococcota bacterium]
MRSRLLILVALFVLSALAAARVRFTTDTADILPAHSALRETLAAAQQFPGAQLLLVEVDGTGTDRATLSTETLALAGRLRALEGIASVRAGFSTEDGVEIRARMAPYATSFVDPDVLAALTSEAGIAQQIEAQRQRLTGFGGAFLAGPIREDPLDLRTLGLKQLQAGARPGIHPEDGLLIDDSGHRALLLVSSAIEASSVRPHDPRVAEIADAIAATPLPTAWFGGTRMAYETATSIERDVRVTAGLGMLLLGAVLFVGFRSWRPLVGAVVPSLVAAGCATLGAWWASPVHGLQLGFSAALAGLAVDYWVHLYLACAAEPDQPDLNARYRVATHALRELLPALAVSAGSTAVAFALLTTSALPIVRVLGITGAAAAAGALLGTVVAGPLAWAAFGRPRTESQPRAPASWATPVALGAVLLGVLGATARFEPDPMALIATGPEAARAQQSFADRYGLTTLRGLVMLDGATPGAALDRAMRVQDAFDRLGFVHASGPAHLLPGPAAVEARRQALPDVEVLQARLDAATEAAGLPPFEGAALRIHQWAAAPPYDLWNGTPLAERATLRTGPRDSGTVPAGSRDSLAMVSVPLQDDTVPPALVDTLWAADPEAQLVVPGQLAAASMDATRGALLSRAVLGGLAVLVVLAIRHRSLGMAVLALAPAGTAIAGSVGLMALTGTPWNPVSLAAMVPVLGLAVDYGVFMTERATRTAPRGVLLSAATTLAGFLTLGLANSPALFGVGVATVAGVGLAAATSLVVLPALLDHGWPGPRVRWWSATLATVAGLWLHADLLFVLLGSYSPPPSPPTPAHTLEVGPAERRFGATRLVRDDGVWLLSTEGDAYGAGYGAGIVTSGLRPRLEEELFDSFERQVPNPLFRWIITRGSLLAGWTLPSHLRPDDQLEILGTADAVVEPYWLMGPLYTRKVYYHAIHDLGQALVDSPLLACTGFAAGGEATADGHWLLARNFDFEGGVAFDRDKIVRVHRPDDGIPYLSIGFTGMVGAVSGVNAEGIAIAINASGSSDPPRPGTPMTLIVREILEHAHDLDEARAILEARTGFVSENVLVVDAEAGEGALFEVTPRQVAVVPVDGWLAVSNHFRSPAFANDSTNRYRMETSTTVPRLLRAEELVRRSAGSLDLRAAADILRDRNGVGDTPLARGHRHALNADIATHGVVIDATTRTVWVSRFPNVAGGFVEVSLDGVLAGELDAELVIPPEADAERALALREGRQLLRRARRSGTTEALELTARALSRMPDHPEALYERGRVLVDAGRSEEARPLLDAALAGPPEYPHQVDEIRALLERL